MNAPAPVDDCPAIELVGLTKRFGRTLAVDDLSLNIPRGLSQFSRQEPRKWGCPLRL